VTIRYTKALDRLLSLTDLERLSGFAHHARRYDLRRMEVLLDKLGNPHLKAHTVHVAGTKGKGSTSAMIASVLTAQGYSTGLFTSPHLHTFRERIQLNGKPISKARFSSLVSRVWPEVIAINQDASIGTVSTFELLTAMAFTFFYEQGADFQVVEVGLGGRLDSTNLVTPAVSVITPISLDHTQVLGHTVELIAQEKAGIIKPGCVAITSPQFPGVMNVLRRLCKETGVRLVTVDEECTWNIEKHDLNGQSFTLISHWGKLELWTRLLGSPQLENAATAVTAIMVLNDLGFYISRNSIVQGFMAVKWPARLEVLSKNPLIVADGAHNPYSTARLMETLPEYFSFKRGIYVVGLSTDKNLSGIVQEISKNAGKVVATRSRHPRASPAIAVAQEFNALGISSDVTDDVRGGINCALQQYKSGDIIVVTGSLFVAAEAREWALGISSEVYPLLQHVV
jgi:dihydrofolate synthase/folylpolyglutamate synthase